MPLKKILSIIICFLFLQTAKAVIWQTVANGNWSAPGVWQGGVAPPSSSADTFLITHNINITANLNFASNALLYIDSMGGICGHYTVTVQSGAKITKFGTINIDVINVPGGLVNCYNPGAVIITQYGVLTNGGQLNTYGCSFTVGPWFNCVFPIEGGIQTFQKPQFNLYPNPTQNKFTVEVSTNQKQNITVYDVNGKQVLTQTINGTTTIDASNLAQGVYNISITNSQGVTNKRLLIVK
jgi:hypothetical protein